MSYLLLLFVYDLRDSSIPVLEIFYQSRMHPV